MSRERRSGRWIYLAAAVALSLIAAWWASLGDPPPAPVRNVEFPHRMRPEEAARAERRRTIHAKPAAPAAGATAPVEAPRDPLLRALGSADGGAVVVFEANALRHSPLGERLVECFLRSGRRDLDRFREESGIDPLEDVDRIALDGDDVLVTGSFGKARWDEAEGTLERPYGDAGRIVSVGDLSIAVWRDEMFVFSPAGTAGLEAKIDRIEGRTPSTGSLSEADGYGDAYGRIPVESLARVLGGEQQPELADKLREAARSVELHLDASHDLAITLDVRGEASSAMKDLEGAVTAAISLGRLQAKASGDDELAELLAFAGVRRGGGGFALDLALPLELLERHLGGICPPEGEGEPTAADEP